MPGPLAAIPAVLGAAARVAGPLALSSAARAAAPQIVRMGAARMTTSARADSLLSKFWLAESGMNMASRMKGALDGNLPSFVHTISVAVRGGPEADLRRVWYLTLAAAFGRWRNRALGVQQKEIEATWDITGKSTAVTIGYTHSGLVDQLTRDRTAVAVESSGLGLLQRGPDQVTVGGNWPAFTWTNAQSNPLGVVGSTVNMVGGLFMWGVAAPVVLANELYQVIKRQADVSAIDTTGTIPGAWQRIPDNCLPSSYPYQIFGASGGRVPNIFRELPRISKATVYLPWRRVLPDGQTSVISYGSTQSALGRIPLLPDDGRVITTGEKMDARVQNPRPQIDGIGRSSTVSLVTQALQSPCYVVSSPPCNVSPLGSPGVQVYKPGNGTDDLALNDPKIAQAVQPITDSGNTSWLAAILQALAGAFARLRGRDGYGEPIGPVPNLRR